MWRNARSLAFGVQPTRRGPSRAGVASALFQPELLRLHAAMEAEELAHAAFALVRNALPVYFQCLTFWPDRDSDVFPFRELHPFRNVAEVRRFAALYTLYEILQRRDQTVFRQSDCISLAQLRHTPFYRAYMRPEGWLHHCVLTFWQDGTMLGLLAAHRRPEQGDFHAAEVQLLQDLHPHLAAAVCRLRRLHQERALRRSSEAMLSRLPLPVIVADWNLRVLYSNRAADQLCTSWIVGSAKARQLKFTRPVALPPALRQACQTLKDADSEGGNQERSRPIQRTLLINDAAGPGWRVHLTLDPATYAPLNQPVFLLHFSPAPSGDRDRTPAELTLPHLARLSAHEQEVALLVRRGLSNQEIAHQLGKSIHTVAKQLQSILRKLAVSSRGRVAALLQ
jgi:DNA-binding CsgD family transcriptional regulator